MDAVSRAVVSGVSEELGSLVDVPDGVGQAEADDL